MKLLKVTLTLNVLVNCLAFTSAHFVDHNNYHLIDNCLHQQDGEYYMKLVEDVDNDSDDQSTSYPIVKVKCQNEFLIVDVNFDPNMKKYFTSWKKWHASIAGPSNSDIVDWTSWYVKSREDPNNAKFLLSPDCSSCDSTHVRQHFDFKSTYWMSGSLFGCMWMIQGKHNCDLDKDTYVCYDCAHSSDPQANGDSVAIDESSDPAAFYFTGQCATSIRASDSEVTASHETCQLGLHWNLDDLAGDLYESEYTTNVVTTHHSNVDDLFETSSYDFASSAWDVEQFTQQVFKPSLGTEGQFCVCSQMPSTKMVSVQIEELLDAMDQFGDDIHTFHQFANKLEVAEEDLLLPQKQVKKEMNEKNEMEQNEVVKTSENNRIELWARDFKDGTYRIKESGTYVIMENIEFNFNAGSLDDPQAPGAWKPHVSQVDEYPGAQSGRDEYFLGFFAGITIECSDVILDLNGFEIGMDEVFYHQQRWFTTISLTSQFFLPGNGPGFFGPDPRSAKNVLIKNGIIGLSSHFGIHGNYNKDVKIENVHVKDFEVHGIQLNGFERVSMKNVEIGPSSKKAFMTGEYGHMRYVLDRLNKAMLEMEMEGKDLEETRMKFVNRDESGVTIGQIAEKCERMMNYAFDYVVRNERLELKDFEDEKDFEEYQEAIELFVNPSGIPYASVLHGIFLNTKEASVLTYNLYTTSYSESATLENVVIHDLTHAMDENVRLFNDIYMFFGPFLNSLSARQLLGDAAVEDNDNIYWSSETTEISSDESETTETLVVRGGTHAVSDLPYVGSIVTDVYLALTKFSNNWDHLERMLAGAHVLVPWSEGKAKLPFGTNIACNMDVMIHSGKGTLGLRLDGVRDVSIKNLQVYNLHDTTKLGETVCGNYLGFDAHSGGGHLAQQAPMQVGFSGNKVQAVSFNSAYEIEIDNLEIRGLESETGPVMGLAIWPANEVNLGGKLVLKDFRASSSLAEEEKRLAVYPNKDHFSCAIFVYESFYKSGTVYEADVGVEFDEMESCDIRSQMWQTDCYKYTDGTGVVYSKIDQTSQLYQMLKQSNEGIGSCTNANEEDKDTEAQVVEVKKHEEGMGKMSAQAWVVAGVTIILIMLYCGTSNGMQRAWRRMNKFDEVDDVLMAPVRNDYGSISF